MQSVWPGNERTTMPSQELLISSSTDTRRHSKKPVDKNGGPKIPYKKACERPAVSVARRNARERKRVHTVNQMFSILKTRLPSLQQKTKRVSKLKILKATMEYIYDLQDILDSRPLPSESTYPEHLRSSLAPEPYYINQQVEKLPSYSNAMNVTRFSQHTQTTGHTVDSGVDRHQVNVANAPGPLKYCSQPKWTNLSLPAVSADQQSQNNYHMPPPLSFNETHRNSACHVPFFTDANNSYDPKYYYYGNQGYPY